MAKDLLKTRKWFADLAFTCPFCQFDRIFSCQVDPLLPDESSPRVRTLKHILCECDTAFDFEIERVNFTANVDVYPFWRTSGGPLASFRSLNIYLEDGLITRPYDAFWETYGDCSLLLKEHGSDDGSDIINRMVFAQYISALEAFLADSLINGVKYKPELQRKLIAADKDLQTKSFKLSEITSPEDFIQNEIVTHLSKLVYHNIGRIQPLYKKVFDIDIFSDEVDREMIEKTILLRHDCVHRNGRDKLGRKLRVFDRLFVNKIGELLFSIVSDIEKKLPEPVEDEDSWMIGA